MSGTIYVQIATDDDETPDADEIVRWADSALCLHNPEAEMTIRIVGLEEGRQDDRVAPVHETGEDHRTAEDQEVPHGFPSLYDRSLLQISGTDREGHGEADQTQRDPGEAERQKRTLPAERVGERPRGQGSGGDPGISPQAVDAERSSPALHSL